MILFLQPTTNSFVLTFIIQFPLLWYVRFSLSTVILFRLSHPEKALLSILMMLLGINIFVSPEPPNAPDRIVLTLPSVGITLFLQPSTNSFVLTSIIQFLLL